MKTGVIRKSGVFMKRSKRLPVFLSRDEQNQLLSVFNTQYMCSHRNKTLCLFLLKTGLRISEAIELKWPHVNLMTGQVIVHKGKGSKDRIVYISENTVNELSLWKQRQYTEWGNADYVFTNRYCKKLDDCDIREMLITYSRKANIEKNVTPHVLRHSFATELLRESKNIRLVQKALGHSSLSTTMIYTHIVDDDFEQAMKAL
jgi:site-specific recombinase XerD